MALLDIDFARDTRWLQQMATGDGLLDAEARALWRDLMACFTIAGTWEATLAAVDVRIATLERENTRLRAALAQAQGRLTP